MIAAICKSGLAAPELLLAQKKINSAGNAKIQIFKNTPHLSLRLLSAAEKLAQDSLREGVAVSGRLELEFLLFLSGTVHVAKALEKMGLKNPGEFVAVMLGSEDEGDFLRAFSALHAVQTGKLPATLDTDLHEIEKMALGRIKE